MASQFFARYPEFPHDPSAPLLEEFERLSISKNWKQNSKRYKNEKAQCIVHESRVHFNQPATKLEGWQALLSELSVEPLPDSITQCKAALAGVWINLVDLLDVRRAGCGSPRRFKSKVELRAYTIKTGKICPKKLAKKDGFIKALMIHVF